MVTFFREVPGTAGKVYFSDKPDIGDVQNIFYPAGIHTIISLDQTAGQPIEKEAKKFGIKQYFYHIDPANPIPMATKLAQDLMALTSDPPILIHCMHGQDRTGFGIAEYMKQKEGYSPEAAEKFVETLTGFGKGINLLAKEELEEILGYRNLLRKDHTKDQNSADDIVSVMRDNLAHQAGSSNSGTVDAGVFADHLSFAPYSDPNGDSYPGFGNIRARMKLLTKLCQKTEETSTTEIPKQVMLPEVGEKSNYNGLSENYLNAPSGSPGAPNGASPTQPAGLVQM